MNKEFINFYFSEKQELEELEWIYSEYNFFAKNKYKVYYPKISEALSRKLIDNPHSSENKKLLKNEYIKIYSKENKIYKKTLATVSQNWKKIEVNFFSSLEELTHFDKKVFACFISRYGPGGSYYPPDKISIRAVMEKKQDILQANESIAHEIVHLSIYALAEKFELGFENTERLVDLILTKTPISNSLKNPSMQGFGDEQLDILFGLYPNDLATMLEEFSKFRSVKLNEKF